MSDLSIGSLASIWASRGWLALLAVTVAILLVAVLRKPCRHWFGAERAFQLWLLPPLALLASQWPHAAALRAPLPPIFYTITSVVGSPASHPAPAGAIDWRIIALLSWLAGGLIVLTMAVVAQRRYRRRLQGAVPLESGTSRWPVLRAKGNDVGPAMVGAWRSRIVLPADFVERYDATEQTLILAHEAAHARRGDGWWSLQAHVFVALFWCHPLAWWALAALRQDQELACDAAVLREHGGQRRSYANAMLKTLPAAFVLPVGCAWSPRHPLAERIAMLKLPAPGRLRRHAGMFAVSILMVAVAGWVHAVSAPMEGSSGASKATSEYQLTIKAEQGTDDGHARHAERVALALCLAPGETGTATLGDWRIDAETVPQADERLRIDVTMTVAGKLIAKRQLAASLGEQAHVDGRSSDETRDYAIDVTPLSGCPARNAMAEQGSHEQG